MFRILFELYFSGPTPLLIFACVGVYLFWIIAYGLIIRHAYKTKMYGFPIAAVAIVWAYEFCFIFFWPIAIPWWSALEWIWFIADTIMLVQCLIYAKNTCAEEELRRNPAPIVLWSVICAVVLMATFVDYYDFTDGVIPAVIAVCAVALITPIFALLKPGCVHLSVSGQGSRALGDLCTALCIWMLFPWVGDAGYGEGNSFNNLYINGMVIVMLISDTVLLLTLITRIPERQRIEAQTS